MSARRPPWGNPGPPRTCAAVAHPLRRGWPPSGRASRWPRSHPRFGRPSAGRRLEGRTCHQRYTTLNGWGRVDLPSGSRRIFSDAATTQRQRFTFRNRRERHARPGASASFGSRAALCRHCRSTRLVRRRAARNRPAARHPPPTTRPPSPRRPLPSLLTATAPSATPRRAAAARRAGPLRPGGVASPRRPARGVTFGDPGLSRAGGYSDPTSAPRRQIPSLPTARRLSVGRGEPARSASRRASRPVHDTWPSPSTASTGRHRPGERLTRRPGAALRAAPDLRNLISEAPQPIDSNRPVLLPARARHPPSAPLTHHSPLRSMLAATSPSRTRMDGQLHDGAAASARGRPASRPVALGLPPAGARVAWRAEPGHQGLDCLRADELRQFRPPPPIRSVAESLASTGSHTVIHSNTVRPHLNTLP